MRLWFFGMWILGTCTALWAQVPQPQAAAPEVLNLCQGEGCDCLAAYRAAHNAGKPANFPIPTIRPFTLYAALSSHSTVLGRYPAKTLATPLGDKTLVLQRGNYQVLQVHNPRIGLQPKDRLDTLLSEGEGYSSATLRLPGGKSKSVSFSFEDVELDTLAETQTQAWTQMRVGKQQGYARLDPHSPFEGCLE